MINIVTPGLDYVRWGKFLLGDEDGRDEFFFEMREGGQSSVMNGHASERDGPWRIENVYFKARFYN
jgi:hypothetical protein